MLRNFLIPRLYIDMRNSLRKHVLEAKTNSQNKLSYSRTKGGEASAGPAFQVPIVYSYPERNKRWWSLRTADREPGHQEYIFMVNWSKHTLGGTFGGPFEWRLLPRGARLALSSTALSMRKTGKSMFRNGEHHARRLSGCLIHQHQIRASPGFLITE